MLAVYALLPLLGLTLAAPLEKRWTRVRIRSGRDGKCLTAEPKTSVGSKVSTVDCGGALLWSISPGSGSITMGPLALDAGENPHNNGELKMWTSYPGLFQQTWYLTDDNRIAITGGDQCLDEGDNGVQTYQCTPYNDNQVWYIEDENGQPPTSASPSPSATSSSVPSPSASAFDPLPDVRKSDWIFPDPKDGGGRRIRVTGRNDLCATVQNGYAGRGSSVELSVCFANNGTWIDEQLWDMPEGTGQVKLHSKPYFCLDAGDNPANGSGLKIYDCLDVPQQQWTLENGVLALKQVNQCLNVRKESSQSYSKPYNYLKQLQTWQCDPNDQYQGFSLYDGPGNDGTQ